MVCFKAFEMKQERIIQTYLKFMLNTIIFFPSWVDESVIICSFILFCSLTLYISNYPFVNGFTVAADANANNTTMQNGLCDRDNFIVNIFYSHFL